MPVYLADRPNALLVGVAAEDQEVAGVEEGGGHVLYRIACGMVYDFGERERGRVVELERT